MTGRDFWSWNRDIRVLFFTWHCATIQFTKKCFTNLHAPLVVKSCMSSCGVVMVLILNFICASVVTCIYLGFIYWFGRILRLIRAHATLYIHQASYLKSYEARVLQKLSRTCTRYFLGTRTLGVLLPAYPKRIKKKAKYHFLLFFSFEYITKMDKSSEGGGNMIFRYNYVNIHFFPLLFWISVCNLKTIKC